MSLSDPQSSYGSSLNIFLDLMESFVKKTEDQILDWIFEYKKEISNQDSFWEEMKNNPDEKYISCMRYHFNLDDGDYDLNFIFTEYFPSFQRKSALISLMSFLEIELKQLCEFYKETMPTYKNFKSKDLWIDKSVNYLIKHVKLNISKSNKIWNQLKIIQKIRNVIVHENGQITSEHKDYKEINTFFLKYPQFWSIQDEILLKDGFLQYVLKAFDDFFEQVDELVYRKKII